MKLKAKTERQWIGQILDKYEAIEKLQPQLGGLDKTWPGWVWKLLVMLMGASHPGLKINRAKNWTAKDLGLFLGRQSALESVVWNEVPLSPKVQEQTEQSMAALEKAAKLLGNPGLLNTQREFQDEMKQWRVIFKNFINESLCSARERPYQESAAFLAAFGKGVVIKPDDLATERIIGVGERIAWVMVMMWRPISELESVAQLHQLLSAAAKPTGIVITLKRVEKLCQRIGLKFKEPGRPKKRRIQTNPPVG